MYVFKRLHAFANVCVCVCVHSVTLENNSDSDDDTDSPERGLGAASFTLDDFHPISRLRNESLRGSRSGSGVRSRRKNSKAKATAMNKVR